MDRILISKSKPGSNGNEGVLHILQSSRNVEDPFIAITPRSTLD